MTATTANPKSEIPNPRSRYDGLGRRTKKFVNTSDPLDQGRPLGDAGFIARLEADLGQRLRRRKPGPKAKRAR